MSGVMGDKAKKARDGWKDWGSQGQRDIRYKFENGNDGLAYFYFENNTPNVTANVTIDFKLLDRMEIQPPYTGQKKPKVVVPPNGDACLWLRSFDQMSKMSFCIMVKFDGGGGGYKRGYY